MLNPPEGVDEQALLATIAEQYPPQRGALRFVPLGEDSWAYRLGDLWISLRRDLRGHNPAAYETAALLRFSGLDFVLAPLTGKDGKLVRRISGFPVVVFPYLPVSSLVEFAPSARETERIVFMLARVHGSAATDELPTETYELSFRTDLDRALAACEDSPRHNGPYAARLHRLLCRHRRTITALLDEFDVLAHFCAADGTPLSLTHGEPIASNILRHGSDLLIADWGDAMWGPPERDWSHVIRTIGGVPRWRPRFLRLYDIRWILSEIAEYTEILLKPHTGQGDDAAMWKRLLCYLPETD